MGRWDVGTLGRNHKTRREQMIHISCSRKLVTFTGIKKLLTNLKFKI